MSNVKFSTYLHILTLLYIQKENYLSSDFIASSINVHPVLIRKAIGELKKNGFIESKEGKSGGSKLAKKAGKTALSAIYKLVSDVPALGKNNTPNPECLVGKQINKHLDKLNDEVEKAVYKQLEKTTLSGFAKQFK
ncbi:hypothetical protein A9P82_01005 [Arachidicoccus ginsenosidimutans]|uniref:Rrf2 family transcriptional regulator n=1 Tax=Arachidicoccus sp. BS20 TaxID=1850526 RepID=UPI0007F1821C|nr:Rrf2 family transcriptional regulator [Arachidicoccus sp. BS20]ANI88022.1 hypothetical protein A9P82_01005 [Arachidicoccus sp. BS20]